MSTPEPEKLPFVFSAEAGALGLRVDRSTHTVSDRRSTEFPIAGAAAEVTRGEDAEKRFTATRVASGVAVGLVFLPLAAFGFVKKKDGHVYLTITSADGEAAIVMPLKVKKDPKARKFAAEFNTWANKLATPGA